ncbi:MAG: GNAT family N-acetyltransferase [Armatimonadetes bacterium]|nr:GNAT family N-acetyltransferase [Armatimonadota bacterium]
MSPVSIYRASPADVQRVAACRHPDDGVADERMRAYLEGRHDPHEAEGPRVMLYAVESAVVVGYIAGHRTHRFGFEGELQYLYVHPDRRRQRIATRLITQLAEWFSSEGISRVCVNVASDNSGARDCYAKIGAQEFSTHWMCWENGFMTPGPHG